MDAIKLEVTARQWATVDASMDNAAQSATDRGEDNERQIAIRQAGWDQVPWVGVGRAWPPDQDNIWIVLEPTQWRLILDTLEQDSAEYRQLGDHESETLVNDARTMISMRITRAGANARAGHLTSAEFLASRAAQRQPIGGETIAEPDR